MKISRNSAQQGSATRPIKRLPDVPEIRNTGKLDLEGVMESDYCFS